MTTIAIDPVRQIVAADTRGTRTSTRTSTSAFGLVVKHTRWVSLVDQQTKITRIDDGSVVVGAGNAQTIERFAMSYPNFVASPVDDDTTVLVLKKSKAGIDVIEYSSVAVKTLWRKTYKWEISTSVQKKNPIFIGSGSKYAKGAYDAGVSVEESIAIAAKSDFHTNDDVKVFNLQTGRFTDEET